MTDGTCDFGQDRREVGLGGTHPFSSWLSLIIRKSSRNEVILVFPGISLGWCQQREKIDWQEPSKFDCWLVRTIFMLRWTNFLWNRASL